MDPRLIGYNRRRQQQASMRRLHTWAHLTLGDVMHGGQARLARQYGVHHSTICRDMKAWLAWVRECQHLESREEMGVRVPESPERCEGPPSPDFIGPRWFCDLVTGILDALAVLHAAAFLVTPGRGSALTHKRLSHKIAPRRICGNISVYPPVIGGIS
jgi:hypothetical protein